MVSPYEQRRCDRGGGHRSAHAVDEVAAALAVGGAEIAPVEEKRALQVGQCVRRHALGRDRRWRLRHEALKRADHARDAIFRQRRRRRRPQRRRLARDRRRRERVRARGRVGVICAAAAAHASRGRANGVCGAKRTCVCVLVCLNAMRSDRQSHGRAPNHGRAPARFSESAVGRRMKCQLAAQK